MILYDPTVTTVHQDYGIMIPISTSRADKIINFLRQNKALDGKTKVHNLAQAASAVGANASSENIITRADLEQTHDKTFIADLYRQGLEKRLITAWELVGKDGRPNRYKPERARKPLTALFGTVLKQVAGTYLACRLAIQRIDHDNFCYYLGGGMHHARYDTGAGFCLLNDVVIAAQKILAETDSNLVWLVDVDAHKGCGSAELIQFAREAGKLNGEKNILNLSIHMAHGWPLDDETVAATPLNRAPLILCDVEIPIDKEREADYLPELKKGVHKLEELSGGRNPDLAIVVDGTDPYEHDGLPSSGLLRLSLDQCVKRDLFIYEYLTRREIPSVWLMAGGYGERAWEPAARFLKAVHSIFQF
ncbi:MAG: histone deacetylase [Treponema sp.]|jgi:acetoin utilization deacetylase AcuC-like enzyme|nr:histone deacetylase [Treponema sp.]